MSKPLDPPAGVDLDVTFINRAPMYWSYCIEYPNGIPTLCPGTENEKRWPSLGEGVTFTAHIVNKGTLASPAFTYQWLIDGVEVMSGTHPALAPGAWGTATYQWVWAHMMAGERVLDDHRVQFVVDPLNAIAETYETNNNLEDRTNALGFRIALTPAMYDAYNTPLDPAFTYSAEDWLQRQIAAMNWAFANSVYPTTPQGATERVRINSIEVTPTPPINEGASDGGWFVEADYRVVSGYYDPVTDIDWGLVHELSHQVGLIDLYSLNIDATSVRVVDQRGTPSNFGFVWPRWDVMFGGDIAPHTDHHLYSSHSAGGISSSKGYRRGYYGEYQFDIPQQNRLLILDNQGNPAGGVQVALYQRNGPPGWTGELSIDNIPEISGTTSADGRLLLSNRPVGGGITTRTGHTLRDNPFGVVDVVGTGNRFLMRLSKGNHEEFAWLDITAFNLAYWQGHTVSHTFVITSHVPPPVAPIPPQITSAQIEGNQASLCWRASPSPGILGYYVHRAAPPTFTYERVSNLLTELCFSDPSGDGNRVYAVTAAGGSESGFSDFVWAPRLVTPYAVGIASNGIRTVLDPQNGYALMQQRADGRYIQSISSPHYHLEYSRYLAVDGLGRLLISHPADYYTDRHSVRVADSQANPLFEFGERGSGPGQFETPAGVAMWGHPCTIEGPHDVDTHTLLLLHFDGSYAGAQGEIGNASGTTFVAGRYAQGAQVDGNDTLTYTTSGNLNRAQGAIEFWVKPLWNGNDGQNYIFFEAGDTWFNRLRIQKDGADNLRFLMWDSANEYGTAYNVAHWQAGEWHHVAATWSSDSMHLFVDGEERSATMDTHPPDVLAPTLSVGSASWPGEQANAVIDEFRISDIPRVGNSDTCAYRILVADSGNHRLQVFDEKGTFIAAYGSFGNGPGQFSNPQGLAVNANGQVVVVDSGNNRLQILDFDGAGLSFSRSITGNVSGSAGVATYDPDRIIVADTGHDMVKVLDSNGHVLGEYTGPNDGHAVAFNRLHGVTVDPTGNIVVADTGNRRIVTITGALPIWRAYLPLARR